eukprot:gene14780-10572_t
MTSNAPASASDVQDLTYEMIVEEKTRVQRDFQQWLDSGTPTESKEFQILVYEINKKCQQFENQRFQELMANQEGDGTGRFRRGGV